MSGLGEEREVRGQQGGELGSGQGLGRDVRGPEGRGEFVSGFEEIRGGHQSQFVCQPDVAKQLVVTPRA